MQYTPKHIAGLLQSKALRPTHARIKILEYLLSTSVHPTADKIFLELTGAMPSLSRTTVYNTLKLLTEAQLVKPVTIEDGELRYDAVLTNHGHFKCSHCGAIYDFAVNVNQLTVQGLESFKIQEKDIIFRGICPQCLKTNNEGG